MVTITGSNDEALLSSLWELGKTPVKVDVLKKYIATYDKVLDRELLVTGFSEGFRLQYTGPRLSVFSKNLVSADNNRLETLAKLQKEINLGRIIGPFINKPISNLRISPIGLVEKTDNTWRLITHLSHPCDNSVNDFIDQQFCAVRYSSFDNALNMVSSLGRSAELGKIDIRQAFRLLIVNPAEFDLLGIMFDGKYYVDKCLPMGCSISCALFEKFASFLHWVIEKESGIISLDHYLDDFLFGGAALTNDCRVLMDTFHLVSKEMGIPLAENKTEGPTTKLTYLGLDIDTVEMKVKIPESKLEKLHYGIRYIISHNKIKLKELESIVGVMAFCARAIPSARAFIRRFYDLIAAVRVKKPYFYIRITQGTKADAKVWLEFLDKFNGECYLPERFWSANDTLKLFSDSTGNPTLGCGAYFDGDWIQFRWPESWALEEFMSDMSFLEFVPVLLAMFTWVAKLRNKKIILRIDNQALVSIINSRTSKSKFVMHLLRPFVLLTMCNNVQFKAVFIQGVHNEIADALSRFQMGRFRHLAPDASPLPADVPQEFLEVISALK